MRIRQSLQHLTATLLIITALSACSKNDDPDMPADRPDIMFYGLTENGMLQKFNAMTAERSEGSVSITGLQSSEKILSIDFRPATGQLFGLGSTSRLYTINTETGAALPVGGASFNPAIGSQVASIDFNPTVDRIRLVTDNGQNLRLHPELGTVAATDGTIKGGSMPSITSVAYTNSKSGATSTTLYDIDVTSRKLYKQDPPNDGMLVEVGDLGINFSGKSGFDINSDNSTALATFMVDGRAKLYQLNLETAQATFLADLAENLVDIAIPTEQVAYAVDENNNLQIFNPSNNDAVVSKAITGIQMGEKIVGIDFRPATGQLYALGNSSRIYAMNLGTGAAMAVGNGGAFTLAGTSFGFDFNPTVDRIRVVSNTGQNLRLNPNDGALAATDGMLNPGTPMVNAAAYTNNFAGATSTVLFVMDAGTQKLYRQDPPNNGVLVEAGNLGMMIDAANGFDIGSMSGMAYAVLTSGNTTKLYSINLTTGAATSMRDLPNKVVGFSVGTGF